MSVDIVIPTAGRPSLSRLLRSIGRQRPRPEGRVLIVDDRPAGGEPIAAPEWAETLRGRGAGPAAARNRGWRASRADWVAFLDDDTELTDGWFAQLERDLSVPARVAASQGTIVVPRPPGRPPTDAERASIGLETAAFATADMSYRRDVLAELGGFDERFPRAYREDSDLALRTLNAGYGIARGSRRTVHALSPDPARTALRRQAGNRDDVLMRALHGRDWRARCLAPRGRLRRHALITVAAAVALVAAASRRPRLAGLAASAWLASTAEFAWARIAPGPRTRSEITALAATSVAIPPLAVFEAARGVAELPRRLAQRPQAVLFDRDGTLIVDVPYNGDPEQVLPMPGAAEAVERLRAAGVPMAVVTNQSAIARGMVTTAQLEAVNRRVEQLLGPIGPWFVCPHADGEGCSCRKPEAGLLRAALDALGREPAGSVMIGDTGADMAAARAVGVRGIMIPTPITLEREVREAEEVAPDLGSAVEMLLGSAR